jgi:hypothetical protein
MLGQADDSQRKLLGPLAKFFLPADLSIRHCCFFQKEIG